MKKGFVLGKFLPLHTGHLALINFARKHCDFLYIIVCFSPNENVDGMVRKQWLYQELEKYNNVSLVSFPYKENELTNTSESSRAVSQKWARALKPVVPDAEIVFTSEPYGDYLAEYMNIYHLIFDKDRSQFPVSGSLIAKEPFRYWGFISDAAKPWYVKKIAILGSESTGKSVLAEKLAAYFDTVFVPEMARKIIEKTNECTFNHLEDIALLHARTIGTVIGTANKLLFLDTDITITKSYSRFLFDRELIVESWIEEVNKSDLYLFLEPDCLFVQDGTRIDEKERNRLSFFHKEQLRDNNIDFISIGGDWNKRFDSAVDIIKKKYFA
jgi:HTH-type transcriptional repressor of NAD biosynthesis genes